MTTSQLQKSLKLYSDECIALLDQACAQVIVNNDLSKGKETTSSSYEFFETPSLDDFYGQDESQSESESSEESASEDAGALPVITETESSSTLPTQPVIPSLPSSKPPRRPVKQVNPRQFEQQVQQHAQHLQRHTVPVNDQCLLIPTVFCSQNITETRDLARALQTQPLIILLLRSGRFAAAIFQQDTCLHHTSSTRYTVRKGQGKAQSSQDDKRRPKSMGSQLRRAGEQALKEDVRQTLEKWKQYIQTAALILVAAPKTMRMTLFETILDKKDPRVRHIPLDVGRPTTEATVIVQQAMMTVWVQAAESHPTPTTNKDDGVEPLMTAATKSTTASTTLDVTTEEQPPQQQPQHPILPLTDLHLAARDANLPRLLDLLREEQDSIQRINLAAGYDFMTPLHFASEAQADACISALLVQGHADPTRLDARRRVPYFLATTDKTRDAFRTARAVLGEDVWDWDAAAKVGPPLTEEEIQLRKEKEAEKKRRKKAKQKEKKAKDKAHEEEMDQRRQQQLLQEQKEEEAKRIRDALPLNNKKAANVCDFCQTEVKGRQRQQMLQRLDYKYCTTECVQKHKRELLAKAAMERFQ